MAKKTKTVDAEFEKIEKPRSVAIATRGIRTTGDLADMMSSLVCDLVDGRLTPQVGNAICNAGGKLLRVAEFQAKYGTATPGEPKKQLLQLAFQGDREEVSH